MMNRLAINTIVRVTRANPSIRTIAPYRWVRCPHPLTFSFNTFFERYFSNHQNQLLLLIKHKQDKVLRT